MNSISRWKTYYLSITWDYKMSNSGGESFLQLSNTLLALVNTIYYSPELVLINDYCTFLTSFNKQLNTYPYYEEMPLFVEKFKEPDSNYQKINQFCNSYNDSQLLKSIEKLRVKHHFQYEFQVHLNKYANLRNTVYKHFGFMIKNFLDHFSFQLKMINKSILPLFISSIAVSLIISVFSTIVSLKNHRILKWVTICIHIIGILIIAFGWILCAYFRAFQDITPNCSGVLEYYRAVLPYNNAELYNQYIIEKNNIWEGDNDALNTFLDVLEKIESLNIDMLEKYVSQFDNEINDILSDLRGVKYSDGSTVEVRVRDFCYKYCHTDDIFWDEQLQTDYFFACCGEGPREYNQFYQVNLIFKSLKDYTNYRNSAISLTVQNLSEIKRLTNDIKKILKTDSDLCYIYLRHLFQNKRSVAIRNDSQSKNKSYYIMGNLACLSFNIICSFFVVFHFYNKISCVCSKKSKVKKEIIKPGIPNEKGKLKENSREIRDDYQTDRKPIISSKHNIETYAPGLPDELINKNKSLYGILSANFSHSKDRPYQLSNDIESSFQTKIKSGNINNFEKVNIQDISTPPCKNIATIINCFKVTNILDDEITAFILFNDDKILSGSKKGSLCISSRITKQWNNETKVLNVHKDAITSFAEINHQKFVSSSLDCTIKVWELIEKKLTLLSTINKHSNGVNKVISSINFENNIISCSNDCKIIIWKNKKNEYKKEYSLKEEGEIFSILELQNNQPFLVANVKDKTDKKVSSLSFWSMNLKKKGKFTCERLPFSSVIDSMIELSNGFIAVSTSYQGMNVNIIDPVKHSVVNKLEMEGLIGTENSSYLSKYDSKTFIFSNNELFNQIEYFEKELVIIFKSEQSQNLVDFDGSKGLLVVDGGKIIISRFQTGFCVIKTVISS